MRSQWWMLAVLATVVIAVVVPKGNRSADSNGDTPASVEEKEPDPPPSCGFYADPQASLDDRFYALERDLSERGSLSAGLAPKYLVSIVPDPSFIELKYFFDRQVEAVERAVESLTYVAFRRDTRPDVTTAGALPLAVHAYTNGEGAAPLIVVFIGESPVAGIDAAAAAEVLAGVTARGGADAKWGLRIVGPTFSGSSRTLRAALDRLFDPKAMLMPGRQMPNAVTVVSGSATSFVNKQIIEAGPGLTRFAATVHSDDALESALFRFLGANEAETSIRMAILSESSSGYGQHIHARSEGRERDSARGAAETSPAIVNIPFPMHVGSLRTARVRAKTGRSSAGDLRDVAASLSDSLRLSLLDPDGRRSGLQAADSSLSAAATELVLDEIMSTLVREGITHAVLLATDVRDRIFLAEEVKKNCPNIRLATFESDVLFLHRDIATTLRGFLVASTYPLNGWVSMRAQNGPRKRMLPFASNGSQGAFNAALCLLAPDGLATGAAGEPVTMSAARGEWAFDVGGPKMLSGKKDENGDDVLVPPSPGATVLPPPVWISAVSNGRFWPLDAVHVSEMIGHAPGDVEPPAGPGKSRPKSMGITPGPKPVPPAAPLDSSAPQKLRDGDPKLVPAGVTAKARLGSYFVKLGVPEVGSEKSATVAPEPIGQAGRQVAGWNDNATVIPSENVSDCARPTWVAIIFSLLIAGTFVVFRGAHLTRDGRVEPCVLAKYRWIESLSLTLPIAYCATLALIPARPGGGDALAAVLWALIMSLLLAFFVTTTAKFVEAALRVHYDRLSPNASFVSGGNALVIHLFAWVGSFLLTMLVIPATPDLVQRRNWIDSIPFLQERTFDLSSGVSPIWPVLCVFGGLWWWSYSSQRRVRSLALLDAPLAIEHRETWWRHLIAESRRDLIGAATHFRWRHLEWSALAVVPGLATLAVAVYSTYSTRISTTFESALFEWGFRSAAVVFCIGAFFSGQHAIQIAKSLRRFTGSLSHHPLEDAFAEFPADVAKGIGRQFWGHAPRGDDVKNWIHDVRAIASATLNAIAMASSKGQRSASTSSCLNFAAALLDARLQGASGSDIEYRRMARGSLPRESYEAAIALAAQLDRVAAHLVLNGGKEDTELALKIRILLAKQVLLWVRTIYGVIRTLLFMVTVTAILGLLASVTYPFAFKSLFAVVAWGVVASGIAAFGVVYVGVARDETLSRIAGTTPDLVGINFQLLWSALVYVIFPISTLVAIQFPGAREWVMTFAGLVKPIQ